MVKEVFFDFFIGLTFLSFFLLTSIQIASLPEVVNFQQNISGVYADPGLEKEEVIGLTSQTLDYIKGRNLSSLPYTPREMFHLGEVKDLFMKTRLVWLISSVSSLLILFRFRWDTFLGDQRLKKINKGMMFTLLAFDLTTFFFFSPFFEGFHQVFFQPGTWAFSETDLLIKLFPYDFWFQEAFLVLGLTTLFSVSVNFLLKTFTS